MSREALAHTGTDGESAGVRWSVPASGLETALPLAAVAVVAAWTGFRALYNAPGDLPTAVVAAAPGLALAAGVVPGVAAVVLGLRSIDATERVGLLFAGVFGALGTVVGAVAIPAAVALVGGGAVVVVGDGPIDEGWRGTLQRTVPTLLLGAVGLSLGAATGLLPPGARSLGATLLLAGLAVSPALVRPGLQELTLGALAAAGVVWVGSTLPFVTGAVTLVAFGLVDTPLVLFAAGVGGCVATVAGALRLRETDEDDRRHRGVGAALVLLAGGPATIGGATAVLLGTVLLAGVTDARGDRE